MHGVGAKVLDLQPAELHLQCSLNRRLPRPQKHSHHRKGEEQSRHLQSLWDPDLCLNAGDQYFHRTIISSKSLYS